MLRSMTNDSAIQHLVDRINELEEENKMLTKEELVVEPTCKKAVDVYGKEHTILAAIDEMSELTQNLTKVLRGKADFDLVDQKVADVEILTKCLKVAFNNERRVRAWKEKKILALDKRLTKG